MWRWHSVTLLDAVLALCWVQDATNPAEGVLAAWGGLEHPALVINIHKV